MELDAFRARLGTSQGRIPSPDGTGFVFVLGDNEPGYFHELESVDHAQIVQPLDLTDIDFVRSEVEMKVPDDLPSGYFWTVSIIVDGVSLHAATCPSGRQRRITDLTANTSKMTGIHDVGVRLELSTI